MSFINIKNKIKRFNKNLTPEGDKSLSIRWALLASQSNHKCKSYNLLTSEDVLDTLKCLQKLGVKIKLTKKFCEISGVGLNGFNYKKNLILNAGNSGTLGRLIMGLLVHSKNNIILKGDKSLSKRDFLRVSKPLKKFGAKFNTNYGKLPIKINGTENAVPINYIESRGSAQCKSAVMLAALNTNGETIIKAKKSRNHSELLFKYLKLPIKIKKNKNFDIIKIKGKKKIPHLNYKIPSDISSSAFFIVLTALSENSKLKIKNININPSRTGILNILKMMGVKIILNDAKLHEDAIHRGPAQTIPAVRNGINGALVSAGVSLLEPKQNVYINVPQELMGSVTGEMSQRRAEIAGMETEGDMAVITAKAPVKEMFGFASEIRSATGGRALWSTEFAGYEPLPRELIDGITEDIFTLDRFTISSRESISSHTKFDQAL